MTKRTPTPNGPQRNIALEIACVVDGRRNYQIASDALVAPKILSGYITGRLTPNEEHQRRIAKTLGRDIDELFPKTQPKTKK